MPSEGDAPAPDECRSDPSAPCFYWHLKLRALNGAWAKLSPEEREFVGVEAPQIRPKPDGWISPLAQVIAELGGMPAAQVARLEQLAGMEAPPQDRLRFLGG